MSSGDLAHPLVVDSPTSRLLDRRSFGDRTISTVEYDGRPVWTAGQIAKALGYASDKHVGDKVTSDWSTDLIEGTDYLVLRGAELAAVKAAAPELVGARAKSLMVLTESGVFGVALLSRQPAGVALRGWLSRDLLPALVRGQLEASRPSTEDRVALQLGRAALRYVRNNGAYDMPRLGLLTRVSVAMLDGDCTSAAQIAKHAGMKKPNAHFALWTAAREGIAIASGDARLASTATWALTAASEETAALEAKDVLSLSERAVGLTF